MSDSDEPQVIQSDSDESFEDTYEESVDGDNEDDDEEDDEDDDEVDDEDDDDDDEDYDDKDLMKSVLNNTQKPAQPTNGTAKLYLKPKPKAKKQPKKKKNARSYQIYKKRSIKCLNSKFKRDKYKSYIKSVFSKKKDHNESLNRSDSIEIICIDEPKLTNDLPKIVEKADVKTDYNTTTQEVKLVTNETQQQQPQENGMDVEITETPERLDKVESPPAVISDSKQDLTAEPQQTNNTPNLNTSTPLNLYKEINELFPKYNKVLTEHVENCDDPLTKSIDGNMLQLENEIKTINDLIKQKELEWNRLLHLKRIKEEIIERLHRQKQKLQIANKQFGRNAKTLSDLKELEHYLAHANTPYSINTTINSTDSNLRHGSVAQLINNRANMRKEELLNENQIINRLQKFLEKNNILARVDNRNKSINKVLPALSIAQETLGESDECADTTSPYKSNAYAGTKKNNFELTNDYTATIDNPYTPAARRYGEKNADFVASTEENPHKPAARKYAEMNDFVATTEPQKSHQSAAPAYSESNLKRQKTHLHQNEFATAANPYQRATFANMKEKSVDLADAYVETTASPYNQSATAAYTNLKRKHIEMDDEYAEDIATTSYKETVYQLYPQNNSKKSNGIAAIHKKATNNFILNTLTPKYGSLKLANAKHSTPFIHGQQHSACKVDKQTYSILETSSDDATLINGNESPHIKLQHINNGYSYDEPQQHYDNGHRNVYYSQQRHATPNKKFILNGHSFVNNRIAVDVDDYDAGDGDGDNYNDDNDNIVRDMPCCQECNSNDCRIACSGCLNQWYCSRECQVAAWSHHSLTCRK